MMLLSEAANQQKKSGDVERKGSVFTLCAVKLVQQVIRWYLKVVNILKNRINFIQAVYIFIIYT